MVGVFATGAFGVATAGAEELTDKEKANIKVVDDGAASWKSGEAAKYVTKGEIKEWHDFSLNA